MIFVFCPGDRGKDDKSKGRKGLLAPISDYEVAQAAGLPPSEDSPPVVPIDDQSVNLSTNGAGVSGADVKYDDADSSRLVASMIIEGASRAFQCGQQYANLQVGQQAVDDDTEAAQATVGQGENSRVSFSQSVEDQGDSSNIGFDSPLDNVDVHDSEVPQLLRGEQMQLREWMQSAPQQL